MQNNIYLLKLFSVRVSNERDWSIVYFVFLQVAWYLFFPYKRSSILECLILRVLHPSLFRRHVFFWQSFSLTDLLEGRRSQLHHHLWALLIYMRWGLYPSIHSFTSPICALCFRIYFHFRNKIRWCFQKPQPSIEADTDGWPVFSIVLMDTLKLLTEFSLSPAKPMVSVQGFKFD